MDDERVFTREEKEPSGKEVAKPDRQRSLGVLGVMLFFLLAISTRSLAGWVLKVLGLELLRPYIIETGIYAILILPLAYGFYPQIYTRPFWGVPRNAWIWLIVIAAIYATMLNPAWGTSPIPKLEAIHTVIFAPIAEEVMRAVMICPLLDRWGPMWAVIFTSTIISLAHPIPQQVLVQEFAISIMFISTNKSIPATSLAHFIGNAIVLLDVGVGLGRAR